MFIFQIDEQNFVFARGFIDLENDSCQNWNTNYAAWRDSQKHFFWHWLSVGGEKLEIYETQIEGSKLNIMLCFTHRNRIGALYDVLEWSLKKVIDFFSFKKTTLNNEKNAGLVYEKLFTALSKSANGSSNTKSIDSAESTKSIDEMMEKINKLINENFNKEKKLT